MANTQKKVLYPLGISIALVALIGLVTVATRNSGLVTPTPQTTQLQAEAKVKPLTKKKAATSPSKCIGSKSRKFSTPEEVRYLFRELGLVYTPKLVFLPAVKTLSNIDKNSFLGYAAKADYYDQLSKQYGPLLDKAYIAPGAIKWVNDAIGYGFFASADVPPGGLVGEYTGQVLKKNAFSNKTWSWRYPSNSSFKASLPTNTSISAHKYGNEIRFINHSRLPNVKTIFMFHNDQWRLLYVAKRPIKVGDEFLVSYGPTYFRRREELPLF